MNDWRQRTAQGLRRARVRITALTVACLLVVLVAVSAMILGSYRRDLVHQVDTQLQKGVDRVAVLSNVTVSLPADAANDDRVQVISNDGQLVFASQPLEGEAALWTPGQPTGAHTVRSSTLGSARVVATPFREGWLVFAEPLTPIDSNVTSLRNAMLLALPALLLAFGLVVWLAVGRALRPVGAAMDREEQLVADVSHELRSPVAGIRVLLETEPDDPGEARLNRVQALASLTRLETITNQLVHLRKIGQKAALPSRPVDLDEIVQRTVQRLRPGANCEIDASGVVPGQVVGIEHDLESLVDNLLTNAVRHAKSSVRVTVTERAGVAQLTVEDDGPGVPITERVHVFKRFTRLDEARARDVGGAGLGLTIVKDIAESHGGSVVIRESTLGGAMFVVDLPASTSETHDHQPHRVLTRPD